LVGVTDVPADLPPRIDDYVSMLAELQERLEPETLALALGARGDELTWIAAGHTPRPQVAERLRMLHDLGRSTDLSDPVAILTAFGDDPPSSLAPLRILARSRYRWALLTFLAVDALVVVGVLVYVFR
jgi:hypothetical protein